MYIDKQLCILSQENGYKSITSLNVIVIFRFQIVYSYFYIGVDPYCTVS